MMMKFKEKRQLYTLTDFINICSDMSQAVQCIQ